MNFGKPELVLSLEGAPTQQNLLECLRQTLTIRDLSEFGEINISDAKRSYLVVFPSQAVLRIFPFNLESEVSEDNEYGVDYYFFKAQVYPGTNGLLEPVMEVSTILDINGKRNLYLPRFNELVVLSLEYFASQGHQINHIAGKWEKVFEQGIPSTNFDVYERALSTMPPHEAVFSTPTGKVAKRLKFGFPSILKDIEDTEDRNSVYVIFSKYPIEI